MPRERPIGAVGGGMQLRLFNRGTPKAKTLKTVPFTAGFDTLRVRQFEDQLAGA